MWVVQYRPWEEDESIFGTFLTFGGADLWAKRKAEQDAEDLRKALGADHWEVDKLKRGAYQISEFADYVVIKMRPVDTDDTEKAKKK